MTVELQVISVEPIDDYWWILRLAPGPQDEAWVEMRLRPEQRGIHKIGDVLPITFTVTLS